MSVETSNEPRSERKGARRGESRRPTRTCVGCGLRDDAADARASRGRRSDEVAVRPRRAARSAAAPISTRGPRASRRRRGGLGAGVQARRVDASTAARAIGRRGSSRRATGGWRGCSSPPAGPVPSRSGPTRRSRRSSRARRSRWSRSTRAASRRRPRCSDASRPGGPWRGGREVSSGACSANDPSQFARFVTRASPAS